MEIVFTEDISEYSDLLDKIDRELADHQKKAARHHKKERTDVNDEKLF